MQPEATNGSKHDSPQQPTPDNRHSSSQHGICDHDQRAPLLPDQEEQREPCCCDDHDFESLLDSPEHVTSPHEATRLTSTSPSPRNRIAEYENALINPTQRRREGPVFDVIKKERNPGDKASPVANFPNEILTHILAHLSPNDLAAVSLVSRRFNTLVATPHAWRVAFTRYFPGPEVLTDASVRLSKEESGEIVLLEKRSFARLSALASWRSEYILRTRLLRSLARGKPVQVSTSAPQIRSGQSHTTVPIVMYNAETYTTINHLHATFGSGLNKRIPKLIHGADDVGMVTTSDPTTGKVAPWGRNDPNFYYQFSERFPGVAEWGWGAGEVVGRPNVMDVSQPHGMIYGQGCPEGFCYYRAVGELRGRSIAKTFDFQMPEEGIPNLGIDGGAICSVWIAKSTNIPTLSEGLVGLLIGSAAGVVTACSLGMNDLVGTRIERGEITARWVLSPGVPIVAIAVDDCYSPKRHAQNRIWAVALNALGELFYLTKFPTRSLAGQLPEPEKSEHRAWRTGRSVYWNFVELTRRTRRPDPYNDSKIDGSYSPRSSWDGMCLSKDQIVAETEDIQDFIGRRPKDFRELCLSWDMQRCLEVDFAGDDGNYAGEAIMVFDCGLRQVSAPVIHRYTRWRSADAEKNDLIGPEPHVLQDSSSLFGGPAPPTVPHPQFSKRTRSSSYVSANSSPERPTFVEEWRTSNFTFGGSKVEITTTALDNSTFATMTMSEDPALGFSTASTASSPFASPHSVASQPASPSDIPGQRARLVSAGTSNGVVLVWDMRAPVSPNSKFKNDVEPLRIIYTESPEISCLALTGLHLIHGGNDGLVQAWDPLASSLQPIKTLNSRFSSRARRRLVQAQASVQGVGINMFAAGAIVLDPDPTVLRGAVSLGNQIRYWSYSSSAADQYKSSKRKLRQSERGSNTGGDRISGVGRASHLKDYIANEQFELYREKQERSRQASHMTERFGVDLLSSEEEALAYAAVLSQASLEEEEKRRREMENSSAPSSTAATPEPSIREGNIEGLDSDLAEAIRLSLQESSAPSNFDSGSLAMNSEYDIPIRYSTKGRKSSPRSKGSSKSKAKAGAESSAQAEMTDLEFALQLSLAEEQSRKESEDDAFPPLSPVPGKEKGKSRMM